MSLVAKNILAAALFAATAISSTAAGAETLFGALSKAYQLNSTLEFKPRRRAGHRRERADRQVRFPSDDRGQRQHRLHIRRKDAGERTPDHRIVRRADRPDAVRRLPDQEQRPRRRGAGARLGREPAQRRAEHAVRRGQRLYGRHPRPADRRADRTKPSIPDRTGPRRALALRGWRGNPHGRRPGRCEPLGRSCAACLSSGAGSERARPPIVR